MNNKTGEVFYVGDIIELIDEAFIVGYDPHINSFVIEYQRDANNLLEQFNWPAYLDPFNIDGPELAYHMPGLRRHYDDSKDILYDVKREGIYYMYEEHEEFEFNGIYYLSPVYPLDAGPKRIQMQAKLSPTTPQIADQFSGMKVDGKIIRGEVSCIFSSYKDGNYSEHEALYNKDANRTVRLILDGGAMAFVKPKYFKKVQNHD